jgi:hypothetical protein
VRFSESSGKQPAGGTAHQPLSILLFDWTDVLIRAASFILSIMALAANAAIIDRVAVSVGTEAITESEIEREIRLTALLNTEAPDVSPAGMRKAAERLVEQALIRREIELSRYPTPEISDIEKTLDQIKTIRFGGEKGFQQALGRLDLTEDDVKRQLLWQTTLLRFIEMRFRPGVHVTEEDIREYFDKEIRPITANGSGVSIEDYRDRIEQAISGERADKELDAWMREARSRTRIVYHPEAFEK